MALKYEHTGTPKLGYKIEHSQHWKNYEVGATQLNISGQLLIH